jgi:perosamine synthetase
VNTTVEREQLALYGGSPAVPGELPLYCGIGDDELAQVQRVFCNRSLSGFYGSWGDQFLGGDFVRAFEAAWGEKFGVPHVVSVNSATSGLFAAVGAVGVSPGDEVIVPPYTMSATAMAPLIYGGIPVFADIDPDTFCLDPRAVAAAITPKTRAVIAVNLFGHPAQLHELAALCRARGIKLIEDNAQGPLATENGRYAGTIGDIGVFSLNYHKHIHTGEGGMCVTRDPQLALRLQGIRNHGENIVEHAPIEDMTNMVGFNYRMTEMSAAVGLAQLRKIEDEVMKRQRIAEALSEAVQGLEGLIAPVVRPGCRHVYYVWSLRIDEEALGVSREDFSAALAAEGFPHFLGYLRPLYLLPIFQRRIAIGRDGWPFNLTSRSYAKGLCPVAERMYERELLCFETCAYDLDETRLGALATALRKVHAQRHRIRGAARQ